MVKEAANTLGGQRIVLCLNGATHIAQTAQCVAVCQSMLGTVLVLNYARSRLGCDCMHDDEEPLRIPIIEVFDLRAVEPREVAGVVPLADRAVGNLQQWLVGTHQGLSRDQLQVYLDEFVFRHNRRRQRMGAFQTPLGLGIGCKPTS